MIDEEENDQFSSSQTLKLFGHEQAEQTLLSAFNNKRLHHGWIISGEKGLGKASLAHIFARFLLTQPNEDDAGGLFGDALEPVKPTTLEIDPENPMLARLLAGGHGNIKLVERRYDEKKKKIPQEIGVDQIRELSGFFNKTAAEKGWRIAIIDSVDELTRNAANALLKMLEEPPEKSILLLISHAPGRLLPTILSRCQKLPLSKLPASDVHKFLDEHFSELKEQDKEAIAKMADGSPGRAIEYAQTGATVVYTEMLDLINNMPKHNVSKLHKFAEKLAKPANEKLFNYFCFQYPFWLGSIARHNAAEVAFPHVFEGEVAATQKLLTALGVEGLIDASQNASELVSKTIGLNLDKQIMVITLLEELKSAIAKS